MCGQVVPICTSPSSYSSFNLLLVVATPTRDMLVVDLSYTTVSISLKVLHNVIGGMRFACKSSSSTDILGQFIYVWMYVRMYVCMCVWICKHCCYNSHSNCQLAKAKQQTTINVYYNN